MNGVSSLAVASSTESAWPPECFYYVKFMNVLQKCPYVYHVCTWY